MSTAKIVVPDELCVSDCPQRNHFGWEQHNNFQRVIPLTAVIDDDDRRRHLKIKGCPPFVFAKRKMGGGNQSRAVSRDRSHPPPPNAKIELELPFSAELQ